MGRFTIIVVHTVLYCGHSGNTPKCWECPDADIYQPETNANVWLVPGGDYAAAY